MKENAERDDDEFKYLPFHEREERIRLRAEGRTTDSIEAEMIALLKRDPEKAWSLDPLLTALHLPQETIAGRDIIWYLLGIHVLRFVQDDEDLRVKLCTEVGE